jgi:hypothetical protein
MSHALNCAFGMNPLSIRLLGEVGDWSERFRRADFTGVVH